MTSSRSPAPAAAAAGRIRRTPNARPSHLPAAFPTLLLLVLATLVVLLPSAQADFSCSKPHALGVAPGANGLCECGPGWFGPTCEVCTTDQACGILLKDPDGLCRNTTFTAIRESFGWCAIASQDVTNLIHGDGFVQIYYGANGTFFFDFIKRKADGVFLSLFRCSSKVTKVIEDPKLGQVKYSSPDLVCNMTCEVGSDRTCTKGLTNIVAQVGAKGGSQIVCDPKARTCDVHENTLDTFLGGVKTSGCYMSECALKGETVTVSVGSFTNIVRQPPAQQTAYILGMFMLTAVLAMSAIASSYYARSGKFGTFAGSAHALEGKLIGAKEDYDATANDTTSAAAAAAGPASSSSGLSPTTPALEGQEAGTGNGAVAVGVGAAALAAAGAAAAATTTKGGAGDPLLGSQKAYSVVWDGITYQVGKKQILKGVSGFALPGELLAIMGPSGSGKTTMIDILAMKTKRGETSGRLFYGGRQFGADAGADEEVREAVGFVDQEDNLMGTLTVYESVLFSAFLRLPDAMSMEGKTKRVLQVLQDLRIAHVADSFIGIKGRRGISGGEKRRVVVAMEMVKVPAILFLDEPTSGLDSFNAALLVDCLKDLATRNATNVVMTIHQPRSNVFTGFDRNLVLNQGEVTYFGTTKQVSSYFASIGHAIPADYNPADFLIDVLFLKCACDLGEDPTHHAHHPAKGGTVSAPAPTGARAVSSTIRSWLPTFVGGDSGKVAAAGGTREAPKEIELVEGEQQQLQQQAPRFKKQGSRATFRQRLGTAMPGATGSATPTSTGASSPPRVVRVDMGDVPENVEEEEKEEAGAQFEHASPPTTGPFLVHHTSSSSKLEHLLPVAESNPFALAFRRSEAYKLFLHDMEGLLGKEEESSGTGSGNNSGDEEGTTQTVSPLVQEVGGATGKLAASSSSTVASDRHHLGTKAAPLLPWRTRAAAATRRWCWEVGVLSRRSLLDLTRNPVLFLSHVGATTYFAVVLGTVYYQLSMSSLQAIQNRLGAFLLACVFLCFTSVSALPLFWLEKNLYLHEQSNRFYSASAYFVCKVFFDLLPLRVIPTVIFGAVTYGMIGLRPGFQHFIVYESFLVLLVCTSALINLIIGMMTRHIMSGILIATIVMIHFLMLTNLFINFDSMNIQWLKFLKRVSFFNYAYEGLSENELVGRRLEHFAISTGTGVLHELGFSTTAMYFDLMSLMIYLLVTVILAFGVLKVCVREMR